MGFLVYIAFAVIVVPLIVKTGDKSIWFITNLTWQLFFNFVFIGYIPESWKTDQNIMIMSGTTLPIVIAFLSRIENRSLK